MRSPPVVVVVPSLLLLLLLLAQKHHEPYGRAFTMFAGCAQESPADAWWAGSSHMKSVVWPKEDHAAHPDVHDDGATCKKQKNQPTTGAEHA